jgi:PPM family protein phosphatase
MSEPEKYRILHAHKSDIGKRRTENQDCVGKFPPDTDDLTHPKGQLFIVADGMGGHEHGKEASETAVRVIGDVYYVYQSPEIIESLRSAVLSANEEIFKTADTHHDITRMGTTCSALVLSDGYAYIGHVGDSRVYHVSESGIAQLTDDHTQVAELVRRGILTHKEAKNHPSKSVLNRALGVNRDIDIDLIEKIPLHPGDVLVLCTDGLAKVKDDEIKRTVLTHLPETACDILIDLANQRGGDDNITVQVIRYEAENGNPTSGSAKIGSNRTRKLISRVMLLFLVTLIALYVFGNRDRFIRLTSENIEYEGALRPNERIEVLLRDAHQLYLKGELDSALAVYRGILLINPLHLGASEGIENIADEYIHLSAECRDHGNYDRAIFYLTKVAELQPFNRTILMAEIDGLLQLNAGSGPPDAGLREPQPMAEVPETGVGSTGIELPAVADMDENTDEDEDNTGFIISADRWSFPGLSDREYGMDSNGITFYNSSVAKKALYTEYVGDIDIDVQAHVVESTGGGVVGIILGYDMSKKNAGGYYLFTINDSNMFMLRKISSDSDTVLLSAAAGKDAGEEKGKYRLSVKLLGPWVMIYRNDRMLQAWLSDEIIRGAFGLYADPGIEVVFSDIRIMSALRQD